MGVGDQQPWQIEAEEVAGRLLSLVAGHDRRPSSCEAAAARSRTFEYEAAGVCSSKTGEHIAVVDCLFR